MNRENVVLLFAIISTLIILANLFSEINTWGLKQGLIEFLKVTFGLIILCGVTVFSLCGICLWVAN